LSIVIPSYNRPEPLRHCLNALSGQDAPVDEWEVIVVDDGSASPVADALADLQPPFRLKVLRQVNAGPGAARNRGVHEAQGSYCLFLDDDTIPTAGLLSAHLARQRAHGGAVVVGKLTTEVAPDADWFARAAALRRNAHFSRLDSGSRPVQWKDCYSGNLSAPRATLLAAGGFAVDLPRAEDVELGFRLARAGLAIVYAPDACAHLLDSKRLPELARDLEHAGEAVVLLARRHPSMPPVLLGRFGGTAGARQRRLLRGLLTLGVPPQPCAILARMLWSGERAARRGQFFFQYCFWRGVRRALRGDRDTWRSLTGSAGQTWRTSDVRDVRMEGGR
jgi:GT2 family glycosyltransferase